MAWLWDGSGIQGRVRQAAVLNVMMSKHILTDVGRLEPGGQTSGRARRAEGQAGQRGRQARQEGQDAGTCRMGGCNVPRRQLQDTPPHAAPTQSGPR